MRGAAVAGTREDINQIALAPYTTLLAFYMHLQCNSIVTEGKYMRRTITAFAASAGLALSVAGLVLAGQVTPAGVTFRYITSMS